MFTFIIQNFWLSLPGFNVNLKEKSSVTPFFFVVHLSERKQRTLITRIFLCLNIIHMLRIIISFFLLLLSSRQFQPSIDFILNLVTYKLTSSLS